MLFINSFLLDGDIQSYHRFISDFNYDWDLISHFQYLPADFIKRFKKKLNWKIISQYQILSSAQLIQFGLIEQLVDWKLISKYQNINKHHIIYWFSDVLS